MVLKDWAGSGGDKKASFDDDHDTLLGNDGSLDVSIPYSA